MFNNEPTRSRKRFTGVATPLVAGMLAVAFTASVTPATAWADEGKARLLGETTLPYDMRFEGTTVGGLSGLDYDRGTGEWFLISDDRSEKQPARFYRAKIPVGERGVGPVELTGTSPLLRADGTPFPPLAVDPEEIRIDPVTGDLRWSTEGTRQDGLVDPAINTAGRDGTWRAPLPLAPNLAIRPDSGPRDNEGIEAMTYAAGGALIVNAIEGSMVQDGPSPTPEHGALSRITVQDRQGEVVSQYAYPLDPVFARPPGGEFANNGITAILTDGPDNPDRGLVMERSFVTGVGNSIRIYEVDISGASDVKNVKSLRTGEVQPLRKRLLADLSEFDLDTVDNVEGMAWGPRLPSGERSLLLVSDDNFSAEQTTQVIALAVR